MNRFIARPALLGAVAWALLTLPAAGQATIDDPDASPADLAARLDGPGVTLTNPSIPAVNGSDSPQQYGLFSNGNLGASLAIDEGIVLSTGTVADALGPNDDDNAGLGGGATYLDSDIAGIDSLAQYNAAILTFDLTLDSYATGFEIDYQFGSEEYPDYVGSRFNDVFAFFLSGPGVSGTENIAQAPLGGNVRINNINIGTVGCSDDGTSQDLSQSAFYQNNGHVTSLPGTCQTGTALPGPFPVTTEFNGLTTKLSARRSGLNAGATYQVKFALADVADQRWDSGVFIELISATYDVDHADAPASYGAPTHSISNPLTLGTGVTGETSGYDDAAASADSDDGVTIPTLAQGASATIPVSVTQASGNQGYLQGWIDWNGDGDFADAGEQVATDLQSASAGTSTISVPVTVPATATTGPTFARFRWSATSGLDSTTAASDGEVEDYQVTVQVPPSLPPVCPAASGNYRPLDFSNYSGTTSGGRFSNVGFASDGTPLDFQVSVSTSDTVNALGDGADSGKEPGDLFIAIDAPAAGQRYEATVTGTFVESGTTTPVAIDALLSLVDIDKKALRRAETVIISSPLETVATETDSWLLATEDGPTTFFGTENDDADTDTRSMFKFTSRNQSQIVFTVRVDSDPALTNPTSAGFSIDGDGTNVGFNAPDCNPIGGEYSDAPLDGSSAPAGGVTAYGEAVHKGNASIFLGTTFDEESASIGNAGATGDGADDDALSSVAPLQTGQSSYSIAAGDIAATGTGTLHAWLDFDGDGGFDTSEYASAAVTNGTVQTDLTWTGQPTMTATGTTFLRLRFADDGFITASTPATFASNGEVEDYAVSVLAPPLLDLNSAATLGDTDRDTALAYTEGDGAGLVMPSAGVSAQGEDDIVDLTIDIQDVFDGDDEIVTIGGESFPLGTDRSVNITFAGQDFSVDYDATNLIVNVTSDGASPEMDEAALDALLQSMTYEHVGENPTAGDRDYDVSIMDPDGLSAQAVAAITVAAVNDPPTLDFDGDDSSGTTGADYATSFAAGDAPVLMADGDVAITDADDTTLASSASATLSGFVDTGNEIVTMGGAAFTIGTANVSNVTVGNTTFEIDFDGGDFSITVTAGTGEIADWEALFASMSYEHTLAAPTPGDRVLSFTVTDPDGAVSNAATSTVTVSETPTDLAMTFDPVSGTPTIGFPETFVLNLVNEGAIAATGVSVSLPLPAGWAYESDDTGGDYDPATGIWTAGSISAGVTETVEFSLVPLASGPYDLTAEVGAANETDSDSTPGNGVSGEDDQAELSPAPDMGTGTTLPAPSCSTILNLDWDSESWAPGTRSASFSYSGISVDVDITDPQGALDATPNGPMPVGGPFYQGGLGSVESSLIYETDDTDLANGDVTTQIDFGQSVSDVRLSLFDIDASTLGPRLEQVSVRGFNGATSVSPVLNGGSAISISGSVGVGVETADATGADSGDGTLSIAFTSPVDRVEFDYGHGAGTDRSANPGNPGFSLHDVSFCAGSAELSANKTIALFDGSGGGDVYALPGEDVIYTINVSNTGTGPTDLDSVVLIDRMPEQVEFFTGDIDTGGPDTYPGSDPVGFVDSGSGLTFTYGSDVGFSDQATQPAGFSACTYTPTGTYDPDVTYICFNPKGQMPAGDPDPEFSLAFRARIR